MALLNRILHKVVDYFDTAPKLKSDDVLLLEKAGMSHLLIEAIDAERKARREGVPNQTNSGVTVRRVGEHA